MSDRVQITIIICATLLIALWQIRSALKKILTAEKEDLTFSLRIPGGGLWLFRGKHRPTKDALPGRGMGTE